jgi:hypothetical protein
MTSRHIVATMFLDNTVAFDTIVAFVIPLIVLLTSLTVKWCEEHLWKFSVLQKVHLSNLVLL